MADIKIKIIRKKKLDNVSVDVKKQKNNAVEKGDEDFDVIEGISKLLGIRTDENHIKCT